MTKKLIVDKKYLENEVKKILIRENDWCQAFGLCGDSFSDYGFDSEQLAKQELSALANNTEEWFEDKIVKGNSALMRHLDYVSGGADKYLKGLYGKFEEGASTINREVFYGGNDIVQAIGRLESGDTLYIPKVKNFFKIFNVRCNKEMVLKNRPRFKNKQFGLAACNDPGTYCINEKLAETLDSFYENRRAPFIKKIIRAKNNKQRLRLYKAEAKMLMFRIGQSGGIPSDFWSWKGRKEVIQVLASDDLNNLEELKKGKIPEDPYDEDTEIIDASCGFDLLFCVLDQVDIDPDQLQYLHSRVANRKSNNWSHFLDNFYKKQIFPKTLEEGAEARLYQKWYIYTLAMTFDPYGSRLYGEWETRIAAMLNKAAQEKPSWAQIGGNITSSMAIMVTETEAIIRTSAFFVKKFANPATVARLGLAAESAVVAGPAAVFVFVEFK